ncbi:hypothetical protein HO173_008551 [Letharia columbiana]|uniref:Major facilitator superfamily (MFS) profile domain-containing protein n=1 Tax=Letharia columbiana TaxID=112416 RepID=A0A8H6L2N5_9LECA|nr:uncharacterized protein HO173_008551 [Letharia columbiana]KAF6233261.1 hypothetical protein HO173_008551 [Letharia columbiana]
MNNMHSTPLTSQSKASTPNRGLKSPTSETSTSMTPTIVPKAKRRGLLSQLTLISELENSKEYSRSIKWLITFTVSAGAAVITTGENIFYPSLQDTASDLHTSLNLADLTLSLSKIGIAFCPLWWSAFSEHLGRRTVYIVSFFLFVLWSVLAAISKNIGMLLAMRFLSASAASSFQSVGAGTVADMWEPKERGAAMGIYYLGNLGVGLVLGPLLGGILTETWGWRATQWFLAIYGGVVLVLIIFNLPETSPRQTVITVRLERSRSNSQSTENEPAPPITRFNPGVVGDILIGPFHALEYLRFPAITITIYIASIAFGTTGLLNISYQSTFSRPPYSLSPTVVGCIYIPIGVGCLLGSVYGGKWSDSIMAREARKAGRYRDESEGGGLIYRPEDRVRGNAWLGVGVFASLLVWYGWVVQQGVVWWVPMIAGFLFGASSMILFGLVTTMVTELLPNKPASGVALNSMGRNLFACVGFAIAQPLIDVMGNGWLFTAAGIVMLVTGMLAVEGLRRYGAGWREGMSGRIP